MPEGYSVPSPTYTTAQDVEDYFTALGETVADVTDREVVQAEDDIDRATGGLGWSVRNDDSGRKHTTADLDPYQWRYLAEAVAEQVYHNRLLGADRRALRDNITSESADGFSVSYGNNGGGSTLRHLSRIASSKLMAGELLEPWGTLGGGRRRGIPIVNVGWRRRYR